jgi:hypothetical protein
MPQTAKQDYLISVLDTDGDQLLKGVPFQAASHQDAWQQAIAIAFRACLHSGAHPVTISVVKRR